MRNPQLLSTQDMARFAASGYLRMDGVVPSELNQRFLDDIGHVAESEIGNAIEHYGRIMGRSAIPIVAAGTPLSAAYPQGSALAEILRLPAVSGAINSLVGAQCVVDHHFLHITFPPHLLEKPAPAQHNHQDSTIDPRQAFDLQIMYFPHDVSADMGGTRFIPGTHLRIVSETAIARYQNILGQQHMVCPAGTLLFVHHGMWHGGGANRSDRMRYMFKIRLSPTQPQQRLWDTSDLDTQAPQKPIFWLGESRHPDDVHTILTDSFPWHEQDTGRLEHLNAIRFWRYLTGDDQFDADYWLTRIENEPR
jgi:hypothetical protein